MKNKVKLAKYIVISLIVVAVMIVFYDYLDTEVLEFLNEKESIIKTPEGIDKYVSPLKINKFIENLKEADEKAVGDVFIEDDKYLYSTYYDLIIIPKETDNIERDVLSEIIVNLEQHFNIEALIYSLASNLNEEEVKQLVSKLNNDDYSANTKGLIINKTDEFLRIKRNMTY